MNSFEQQITSARQKKDEVEQYVRELAAERAEHMRTVFRAAKSAAEQLRDKGNKPTELIKSEAGQYRGWNLETNFSSTDQGNGHSWNSETTWFLHENGVLGRFHTDD